MSEISPTSRNGPPFFYFLSLIPISSLGQLPRLGAPVPWSVRRSIYWRLDRPWFLDRFWFWLRLRLRLVRLLRVDRRRVLEARVLDPRVLDARRRRAPAVWFWFWFWFRLRLRPCRRLRLVNWPAVSLATFLLLRLRPCRRLRLTLRLRLRLALRLRLRLALRLRLRPCRLPRLCRRRRAPPNWVSF